MQEAIDAVQARLTAMNEENQPSTPHCKQAVNAVKPTDDDPIEEFKDEPPTPPWKTNISLLSDGTF